MDTPRNVILIGDVLQRLADLPDESVHCVVTSPPYWGLRDYGAEGQIGLEPTPEAFVSRMVEVFREVRRVLRRDGTCWVNLGDTYARDGQKGDNSGYGKHADYLAGETYPLHDRAVPPNLKPKDLVGIPWRVAFALQTDGWYLRSDIIWAKPNTMPESVTDRPTKAHEYVFLLTKSSRYYYDADAVRERTGNEMSAQEYAERTAPGATWQSGGVTRHAGANKHDGGHSHPNGRNRRTVWTIPTEPFPGAHFATFPQKLVEPCILAGCPEDGIVLDPFFGSGTVGIVALKLHRLYIGIELNPAYAEMARNRIEYGTVDPEEIADAEVQQNLFNVNLVGMG